MVLELLTHIFREEDDKERSDQVINSLDIPTGGVSDGPDKENSFKDLLDERLLEQGDERVRPWNVDVNLSVGVLVVLFIPRVVILLNKAKVLLPLPLQGELPPLGVCREIALKTTVPVRG